MILTDEVALCLVLIVMAVVLTRGRLFPRAQPVLGIAVVSLAVLNLIAYAVSAGHALPPEISLAFLAAGLIVSLLDRPFVSGAVLVVQCLWLILFVIAFSSFAGYVLSMMLGVPFFEHGGGRGWASSGGLLLSSMLLLSCLRRHPGIRAFYEGRQDRQIAAQGIVLFVSAVLISGLGGAGILTKETVKGFQGSLSNALQANSRRFGESVKHAEGEASKIAVSAVAGDNGASLREKLESMLELHKRDGIVALWVRDLKGGVVAAAGELPGKFENRIRLTLDRPAWLLWHKGLFLQSVSPLYQGGRKIGELEMETDLRGLNSEFDLARSFGQFGAVVVCAQARGMMDCFSSIPHRDAFRIPAGGAMPMRYALEGKEGAMIGRDYRGEIVVAAYQPVDELGLGMVEKIDADALYSPVRRQLFVAILFFLMMAGLAAWMLYRRMRPLVRGLITSEAHTRSILDNIPEGVIITDEKGIIRSFNPSAQKIFGFGHAGEEKIFHMLKGLSDCMAGHCPGSATCESSCTGIEGEALRHDNTVFPYEMTVGEYRFGGERRYVSIVKDLTERRRAEKILREKERYTRYLLENIQTAVVVHGRDGSVSYLNAAAQRFFGLGADRMTGSHVPSFFMRFLREDGSTMPLEELPERRVLADGKLFYNYVVGVELQDEPRPRWALVNAFPDFDEDGAIREVIVSFVDITDRKNAQGALVETSEKLESLNRLYRVLSQANAVTVRTSTRDALFRDVCRILDESGKFEMGWVGLLDEDSGEIIPVRHFGSEAGYLDFLKTIGLMRLDGPAAMSIKEGRPYLCQDIRNDPRMNPWKDEALDRGYRSSGAFPFHLEGKMMGLINLYSDRENFFSEEIVGLMHEICDAISFAVKFLDQQGKREAAEEMLRGLNAELECRVEKRTRDLEAANAELEAFSYSVSHDLRAPLRSIDGFSEILLKKYAGQLDDTAKDYLSRVRRGAKRMGELIEDLLQLSSVTRADIRKEPVDMSLIVLNLIGELDSAKRRVDWQVQPDIVVQADSRLMKIVMENLIGNAWKFTSSRDAASIEFGMYEQDDEKIIYVRDNGVGFDMKYAGKLFGAFQRLHRFDEFEGTGIGLATVQRIIRRHGGRIWAEGEVGVGAAFYLSV